MTWDVNRWCVTILVTIATGQFGWCSCPTRPRGAGFCRIKLGSISRLAFAAFASWPPSPFGQLVRRAPAFWLWQWIRGPPRRLLGGNELRVRHRYNGFRKQPTAPLAPDYAGIDSETGNAAMDCDDRDMARLLTGLAPVSVG